MPMGCESCHSEVLENDDWVPIHSRFGKYTVPAEFESGEHRKERLRQVEEAGMIRSNDIYKIAHMCFKCHASPEAALVNAGHKASSGFELLGRLLGENRHNFHEDQSTNAEGPTLWARRTGGDIIARRRIIFIVGILVDAQLAFEARSRIEDTEVLIRSDFPELLLERAEMSLEYLEISIEVLEDDVPEQLETAFEIIYEGLDADFAEAEAREILAESAKQLDKIARWFATQDGKNLEALDEVLEEFVEPKGTPYQPQ
jgi:hypothetical protein